MDIDWVMKLWVKWKDQIDKLEVNRATGWKPSGIEYRIMLEGKAASLEERGVFIWKQMVLDIDLAWRRAYLVYPNHMKAIETFYGPGENMRSVRVKHGWSQYKTRQFVDEGRLIMQGALAAIAGFNNEGEN